MVEHLLDGQAGTIAREEAQLSSNLQGDFTNPAWHEAGGRASRGVLSARELRPFLYIRLPLCRMTAHLSMARFRPAIILLVRTAGWPSACCRSAMNNEVARSIKLKTLERSEKAVATWARTLGAYASRDFRLLDPSTNAPGIEQIAWFWAYSSVNNRAVAWDRVGDAVSRRPDFCRIVAAMGYGVQMGNVMLQAWLPLELQEIRDV